MHCGHLLSDWKRQYDHLPARSILPGARAGQLPVVHGRVLLQCDGSVGRVGRLQRWLILPGRVDVGVAVALYDSFVLPGAERQRDYLADFALLRVERHERADRVQRGFILQSDWPQRCEWSVQRWILLLGGLGDGDAVRVPGGQILPDRQRELDFVSSGHIQLLARAGQLYLVSDWQLLRPVWPRFVRAVHGRVVLCLGRTQRADRQLQRRLPLSDGIEFVDASSLLAVDLLSRRQCQRLRVSRVVVLRQHGHERGDFVYTRLVLRGRWPLGAKRNL